MAEKFKEQAVIIRQEEISYGIYSMWMRTDRITALAKPGQFVFLFLERKSIPQRTHDVKPPARAHLG